MRRIPDFQGTVYSKQLSKPIRFAMPRDVIIGSEQQASDDAVQLRDRFQFTWRDRAHLLLAFARTAVADERALSYADVSATEYMQSRMSEAATRMLSATFGPWIGIDPKNTSLHHAGLFFRKNFFPGSGSAASISEGAEGWRVLRGPSNESWFDPWVRHLQSRGVEFHFQEELQRLGATDDVVEVAQTNRSYVHADYYVMAVTPFASANIFAKSSKNVSADAQAMLLGLTRHGQHIQISFRIGFSEKVNLPDHTAIILPDSEFNITLLPVDLIWHQDISLGDGIKSLWTGTACVSYEPGKLVYHRPADRCSKEEFIDEVIWQIFGSKGLDAMISVANGGKSLSSFRKSIVRTEVWHEWVFFEHPSGPAKNYVRSAQSKWVNYIGTQQFRPTTKTSISNLFLAGAHVKTDADIWSMEGAAESGRRAAFGIAELEGCGEKKTIVVKPPAWLRALSAVDNFLYRKNLPNVVDVLGAMAVIGLIVGMLVLSWKAVT
jgi:hypothetical protein